LTRERSSRVSPRANSKRDSSASKFHTRVPTGNREGTISGKRGSGRSAQNDKFSLFEALGGEAGEFVVFGAIADLDGTAADFAIFDIDLPGNGKIQDHGDLFAAVWAHESVFHERIGYDRLMSRRIGRRDYYGLRDHRQLTTLVG
jgi:hypothetical protein